MDWPISISITAILISLGSFGVTIWAMRISKRSLDHAIEVQVGMEQKEFDHLRADLLMQIADSRRILDKTRIEIGTVKADFDVEPQPVQVMMSNYTNLFSQYLPKIEASIQQLDALWQEVSGWSSKKTHKDLMDTKALLYRSLKDDEVVYDSGIYMVNIFKAKLEMAKEHVAHVSR